MPANAQNGAKPASGVGTTLRDGPYTYVLLDEFSGPPEGGELVAFHDEAIAVSRVRRLAADYFNRRAIEDFVADHSSCVTVGQPDPVKAGPEPVDVEAGTASSWSGCLPQPTEG